jgi:2-aminoethylphosphonate dioxygenase
MISKEIQDHWQQQGYIIVRELFSEKEIEQIANEADRVYSQNSNLIHTNNIRCRWQDNVFTGECQFDAFDPINDLSPATAALSADLPRALQQNRARRASLFSWRSGNSDSARV